MSESKRFKVINARWEGKGEAVAFEDTQTNQVYFAENQEECERIVELLNRKTRIIKGQDLEIQRLQNLAMAMSGVLREEFGVYDVFDRTKDKKI